MNHWNELVWVCAATSFAIFATWLMLRAIRWARKGSKGASMLAAAAFPFPDQPPPNEQIERINRLRKDVESGEPEK